MGGWVGGWMGGGCLDGQTGEKGAGIKEKTILFPFAVTSVNDTQSLTHLEELQNQCDLRCAELTDLSVACAVSLPLRFPWQN